VSDDWKPGDLAVCVDDSPPYYNDRIVQIRLNGGQLYRITGIVPNPHNGARGLLVDGEPPHVNCWGNKYGWRSTRFRKIKPDAHEGHLEDWQHLLDQCKRKVSA
jgi:hypothetical protein